MSAKHTPGPWQIGPLVAGYVNHVNVWTGTGIGHVAAVCTGLEPDRTAEANARLIAAAPDLLDACRTMGAMILGIAEAIELDTDTEMKISVGGKLAKTITLGEAIQQVTAAIGKATQP